MTAETIVSDDAVIIEEEMAEQTVSGRVSWGAIIAGALIAVATTLFLLMLGSGIGLALVSPASATRAATAFFSLGAIYFLAAQAFGLAVGGHVTGRLIGPMIETGAEEEFRAGAHGLAMWSLAVVITVALVALSSLAAARTAMTIGELYGAPGSAEAGARLPATTGYWVDVLFRPAMGTTAPMHASLDGVRYAQNDTGVQNDASPPAAAQDQNAPQSSPSPDNQIESLPSPAPATPRRPPLDVQAPGAAPMMSPSGDGSGVTTETLPSPGQAPHDLAGDKAEAGRILNMGLADGGYLTTDDRDRLAQLIAQDAGLSYEAATAHVNAVQAKIHDGEVRAADIARKTVSYASIWMALALFFGAIVSTVAAISARWEDDAQSMFPFRRESETRFT